MMIAATSVSAQQEKLLHSFGNGTDGVTPNALISDSAGNLFGTTTNGGVYEGQVLFAGTAFELSPLKNGDWNEKILHSFGSGTDGEAPNGLISDAAGNLYGTTSYGGGKICYNAVPAAPGGCGIVFQLRPPTTKGGAWTEVVLYRFTGGKDGNNPNGFLTLDSSGNLYGTTSYGGGGFSNGGTVFELSPRAIGYWAVKPLHLFTSNGDGSHPSSAVTFDSSGNLYGTTCAGGTYQSGIVFELSPMNSGTWGEKVLYNFNSNGTDGVCPVGGLTSDFGGNLYGTTVSGGNNNYGTVFELTPSSGGVWTEKVLYKFNGGSGDGSYPYSGVLFDSSGNLYGSTSYGSTYNGGAVFKLTPGNGSWTESLMHNFGSGTDGQYPVGNLLIDGSGNLFGVTQYGGAYDGIFGSGTVFEIRP
jgi:uncharacterized repeat protein (TIGR03803 family)